MIKPDPGKSPVAVPVVGFFQNIREKSLRMETLVEIAATVVLPPRLGRAGSRDINHGRQKFLR